MRHKHRIGTTSRTNEMDYMKMNFDFLISDKESIMTASVNIVTKCI